MEAVEENNKSWLKALLGLLKIKITAAVSLTTVTGYIMANGRLDLPIVLPVFGLFLMACGSAALNHLQEWRYDHQMERTKVRPISSGMLTPGQALLIALVLAVVGDAMIYYYSTPIAAALGVFALFWYNGVYTPLKRKTAYAVIPGAFIGAVPPLIGWEIAGGMLTDPEILAFSFFIFMWQIPHFWLLSLFYEKQYRAAGFPSVTDVFSTEQLVNIIWAWLLAAALSALLIPVFGGLHFSAAGASLLIATFVLAIRQHKLLFPKTHQVNYRQSFIELNMYALFVTLVISLDEILYLM